MLERRPRGPSEAMGEVRLQPTCLLLVSLVPYRLVAVGWSPVGRAPGATGLPGLDLRSPLLTCAECYRMRVQTQGVWVALSPVAWRDWHPSERLFEAIGCPSCEWNPASTQGPCVMPVSEWA